MKANIVLDKPCAEKTMPSATPIIVQRSTAYSGMRKQFIALVSAQLLLLIGLAAPKAYTLCYGQTILLESAPVDPDDLFRGEYADLSFGNATTVVTQKDLKQGESVWVSLSKLPTGKWAATSVSKERPAVTAKELALKATISSYEPYTDNNKRRVVQVSYEFQRLYVPRGKSSKLIITRDKPMLTEVAVDPSSGEGCIKQVSYGGHKIFDAADLISPYSGELL